VSLVVSSNKLVMGLADNRLVMLELTREEQLSIIQIPRRPGEMSIYKMFFDPSGRHLIIASTQGETWYIYMPSKKPKQLKSFKMIIESVAWSKSALLSSQSTSTREILIGARNGVIYEALLDGAEDLFKSQDRYLHPVFSLAEKHPITGIRFDMFPPLDPKKTLVVVTTPTRIYQFVGSPDRRSDDGGRVFNGLFASYRDTTPSM
jgi:vacuolar protein sorting-associated protein 18